MTALIFPERWCNPRIFAFYFETKNLEWLRRARSLNSITLSLPSCTDNYLAWEELSPSDGKGILLWTSQFVEEEDSDQVFVSYFFYFLACILKEAASFPPVIPAEIENTAFENNLSYLKFIIGVT